MAKRKISKALKLWQKRYTDTFFGIEPGMDQWEMENGKCSILEYKNANIDWIEAHFNERIATFK